MMKKVLFPRANAVRSLGWLGGGASLSFDGLPVTIVAPLSLHPPTNQTNVSQSVVREEGGGAGENKRDFHSVRCPSVFEKKKFRT